MMPPVGTPRTRFASTVFFIAAVYGTLVLVPQYFMESKIGRDFPPPITHPEHFYGFIGVALAWQFLFFVIARDPARFQPVMWPAVFEKIAFGAAAVVLYAQGRLAVPVLCAGLLDFVFAVLFFVSLRGLQISEESLPPVSS
jgi:hypothetical protein